MAEETRVSIQVSSEEEAEELEALIAETPDVSSERETSDVDGFEPITIIILIGAAAAILGAVSYWHDKSKGGQVIDLTPGADPWAYRSKGVVYGLVIVRAADGTIEVDVKEPKGFFLEVVQSVISALKGLAEKSIETVKDAVKSAVGDKAEVTDSTEPVPSPAG